MFMIRNYFTVTALGLCSMTAPAFADSTKAYCSLSYHEEAIKRMHIAVPVMDGPCIFSQYQGNVYINDFNWYKFAFPYEDDGKAYIRIDKPGGISFIREREYTLNVFWQKPLR